MRENIKITTLYALRGDYFKQKLIHGDPGWFYAVATKKELWEGLRGLRELFLVRDYARGGAKLGWHYFIKKEYMR